MSCGCASPCVGRKKRTERRRRSNLDHWQDEADQKNWQCQKERSGQVKGTRLCARTERRQGRRARGEEGTERTSPIWTGKEQLLVSSSDTGYYGEKSATDLAPDDKDDPAKAQAEVDGLGERCRSPLLEPGGGRAVGHVCAGLLDWEVGSGLTECWPQGVVLSVERAEGEGQETLLGRTRERSRGVMRCTSQRTTLGFHNNKQGPILRKKVPRHTSKDVKNQDAVVWSRSRFERARRRCTDPRPTGVCRTCRLPTLCSSQDTLQTNLTQGALDRDSRRQETHRREVDKNYHPPLAASAGVG